MEGNYTLTPEAMEFYKGLNDRVTKGLAPQPGALQPTSIEYASDVPMTVMECLKKDIQDSYSRDAVQSKLEGWAKKELDTIDISSLLAASISPRIAKMRNAETKFKNLVDSNPRPKPRVLDWLYRVREERIGTQYAPAFNPDGDLPAENQALYAQQFNSLMFVGETLKQSIISSDMANNQADVQLMAEEVDMSLVRIMKAENRYLLRGQLQTSFAPSNIPQCEGFQTGSTFNTIDLMGGDLTHDFISMGQDFIAANFGYEVQLAMMVNPKQVGVLDLLEATYYPGNNAMSQYALSEMLKARLERFNIPIDLMYRPKRGGPPIPVIRETDLEPNTAILFILDHPMEADFMLGGQPGPHTLTRFTERLVYMAVSFKGFTGDFPLREGRVSFSNVAA